MMKQMRFGQKVDLAPRHNPFQKLGSASTPSSSASTLSSSTNIQQPGGPTRQPSGDQSLFGRKDAQDVNHLSLLQQSTLAGATANMQAQQEPHLLVSAAAAAMSHQQGYLNAHEAFLRSRLFLGNAIPLATSRHQTLQQGLLFNPTGRLSLPEDVAAAAAAVLAERDLRNSLLLSSSMDIQRRHSLQSTNCPTGGPVPGSNAVLDALFAHNWSNGIGAIDLEHSRNLLGGSAAQEQQADVPVRHINHAAPAPSAATSQQLSNQLALWNHQQQQQQQTATSSSSASSEGRSAELLFLIEQEQLRRQNDRFKSS